MQDRLLDLLRCPRCGGIFKVAAFDHRSSEIVSGLLHCAQEHFFPVHKGIPRLLPNSLKDYWPEIAAKTEDDFPDAVSKLIEGKGFDIAGTDFDTRTKANFSNEWDNHDIGGKTWTMELDDRVQWFFVDPLRIRKPDLDGKLMLDAGCGNGSQSVAYTGLGLEVVALDLSTGLEKGQAFKDVRPGCKPEKVHFIQADLQNPPLAPGTFDIIHSAGVLHHTPDTLRTFQALRPLLKSGGLFYVWLYKFEKGVTPLVNSIRAVTTRIPAPIFAKVADLTAMPFIGFCWTVNKLGIRRYETPNRREAALAIHDIFGAPYAHYHDYEEVSDWYRNAGFIEIWDCNEGRRGFGVCGRLPGPG
ncbi:MAG: methyltransferase domain-containing protein [Blastocatellia bacterium]